MPRLHLGQIKFFQFKRESIRDSIKDLEAACSFSSRQSSLLQYYGNKKAQLSTQQPSCLAGVHGDARSAGCPGAGSPPWPPRGRNPAAKRAGDGRLEAEAMLHEE